MKKIGSFLFVAIFILLWGATWIAGFYFGVMGATIEPTGYEIEGVAQEGTSYYLKVGGEGIWHNILLIWSSWFGGFCAVIFVIFVIYAGFVSAATQSVLGYLGSFIALIILILCLLPFLL